MIYLFFTPLIILDAGFQLSFSVSFAIILIFLQLITSVSTNDFGDDCQLQLLLNSAALPILLYHFFEISLISIAANLVYIPLFSFVFLPGLYFLYFIQIYFWRYTAYSIRNIYENHYLFEWSYRVIIADFSFVAIYSRKTKFAISSFIRYSSS